MKTLFERLSESDQELFEDYKHIEVLKKEHFFVDLKVSMATDIFWLKYNFKPFCYSKFQDLFSPPEL